MKIVSWIYFKSNIIKSHKNKNEINEKEEEEGWTHPLNFIPYAMAKYREKKIEG